jgi:hypothetical protein
MTISFGMHKLEWLTSKQDVHKEIYTEKKENYSKGSYKEQKIKCGTKHALFFIVFFIYSCISSELPSHSSYNVL